MGKPEATVENYLVEQVEAHNGFTRKMVYQGRKDAPDRIVVLPGGFVAFCECKAPGETLRQSQAFEADEYQKRGAFYYLIDCKVSVHDLIYQWKCWCINLGIDI